MGGEVLPVVTSAGGVRPAEVCAGAILASGQSESMYVCVYDCGCMIVAQGTGHVWPVRVCGHLVTLCGRL